ncbi:MAG TPA: cache domain-containing protein [Candidatus Cloacimonadota bacterium]|nr:cache domain-containing protein [Candidatus Cloacimonadota bacterium]
MRIIFLILVLATSFSLFAEYIPAEPILLDAESVLNLGAGHIDKQINNALTAIQIIAETPEAKKGDWEGIKKYLKPLQKNLPGVYFYVLVNGNYYTVDRDFTNLNLKTRDYFNPLFSGNQIKGFPVYSRSSGKKSIVLATPVYTKEKISGAIGISVYLDQLADEITDLMNLNEHFTWFVIRSDGNTLLDKEHDYIFMNVLTQGSDSMKSEFSQIFTKDKGAVLYEIDGIQREALYTKIKNYNWWMILAKKDPEQISVKPLLNVSLHNFLPELDSVLKSIDQSIALHIQNDKPDPKNQDNIRNMLSAFLKENPYTVNAIYTDTKGKMKLIEPVDYQNFEGTDISTQEHIKAMKTDPKPYFTNTFKTVEDYWGFVISHPVFVKNKYAGAFNVLLRPELLIEPLINNMNFTEEYELWIMQMDGMIIYDQDHAEIGKMLFTDPLYAPYESLLSLGKNILSFNQGSGEYSFKKAGSEEIVRKSAVWDTIKIHNKEWRVVLTHIEK